MPWSAVLEYRLPKTVARFSGTQSVTFDEIATDESAVDRSGDAALEVIAEQSKEYRLTLSRGFLRDLKADLTWNADGRLSGVYAESTGEAGTIVKGLVGAAVALVPGGGGALDPVLGAVHQVSFIDSGRPGHRVAVPMHPPKSLEQRFLEEKPDVAHALLLYRHLIAQSIIKHSEICLRALLAETRVEADGVEQQRRFIERNLAAMRGEAARLEVIYDAWRASKRTTTTTNYEFELDICALPSADEFHAQSIRDEPTGRVIRKSGESSAKWTEVWDAIGVMLVADRETGLGDDSGATCSNQEAACSENQVRYRVPRKLELSLYKRDDRSESQFVRTIHALVFDAQSGEGTITLRRSFWGKRSTRLTFSPDGALLGLATEATSTGAALATSVGELPSTIADALEARNKIADQSAKARNRADEERLARLERDKKLKETQVALDGLQASDASRDELDRLKRLSDMAEAQTKLSQDERARDLELQLAQIRYETERLKANNELADQQKP